jgi:hypothetical protein
MLLMISYREETDSSHSTEKKGPDLDGSKSWIRNGEDVEARYTGMLGP